MLKKKKKQNQKTHTKTPPLEHKSRCKIKKIQKVFFPHIATKLKNLNTNQLSNVYKNYIYVLFCICIHLHKCWNIGLNL